MNVSRLLFPTARRIVPALAPLLAAGAAGMMVSACVSGSDSRVDPASPAAAEVTRLNRQAGKFPTFASIPKPPKDIRPLAQYGGEARAILAQGEALEAATAPGTWTLDGTQGFADTARRDAGPQLEPAKPGDAEAFARELRERATPPPPR